MNSFSLEVWDIDEKSHQFPHDYLILWAVHQIDELAEHIPTFDDSHAVFLDVLISVIVEFKLRDLWSLACLAEMVLTGGHLERIWLG